MAMINTAFFDRPMDFLGHRFRHPGLVLTAGLLLAASLAVATDRLLQPGAFPVQRVSFEGEFKRVVPDQLEKAVQGQVDGNFFLLDLDKVKAAAKSVPWVDRVSVRREWPRSIQIQYTEHRLIARWGTRGWLNSNGEVVDLRGEGADADLPHLAGPAGSGKAIYARYRRLAPLLVRSANLRLTGLRLTERRAWIAYVAPRPAQAGADTKLVLLLGREQLEDRLTRFVQAYRRALADRAHQIKQVDLRYPNGFAVAWKPAYVHRYPADRNARVEQ